MDKKNIGTRKSDEEICVDRPFFNRKHQENEHVEPFPYKSWYNENLSCICIGCLSNLHHKGQAEAVMCHKQSEWQITCDVNLTNNQCSIHDKLYQFTTCQHTNWMIPALIHT